MYIASNQIHSPSEDSHMFQRLSSLGQSPPQPQAQSQSQTPRDLSFYFQQNVGNEAHSLDPQHQLQQQQGESFRQSLFSDLNTDLSSIGLSSRPAEFTETDELFKLNEMNLGGGGGSSAPSWLTDSNARR